MLYVHCVWQCDLCLASFLCWMIMMMWYLYCYFCMWMLADDMTSILLFQCVNGVWLCDICPINFLCEWCLMMWYQSSVWMESDDVIFVLPFQEVYSNVISVWLFQYVYSNVISVLLFQYVSIGNSDLINEITLLAGHISIHCTWYFLYMEQIWDYLRGTLIVRWLFYWSYQKQSSTELSILLHMYIIWCLITYRCLITCSCCRLCARWQHWQLYYRRLMSMRFSSDLWQLFRSK